ncbi:hypothetical protein M8994_17445 [Brucella sp. 21LCYQ03]|nr:hypothetical protein [Brucella sp. 21LCYQ03]
MNINDNPTVNRYLKVKALDLIDHGLGRPTFPLQETYRNYFAIVDDLVTLRKILIVKQQVFAIQKWP